MFSRFIEWLRRPASELVQPIEGLRFISICMVMLAHVDGALRPWHASNAPSMLPVGYRGVLMLFVISGFVIAMPFARAGIAGRPMPSLKRYFVRRLARVEPPYVLSMVAIFGYAVLVASQRSPDLWQRLLASLSYTHNLIYASPSALNVVAWSLEVEVQFYLLAPLMFSAVFYVRRRALRVGILGAATVLAAVGAAAFSHHRLAELTVLSYGHYFLLGALLADLYLLSPAVRHRWVWDAFGIASIAGLFLLPYSPRTETAGALASFAVAMVSALRGRSFTAVLSWRPCMLLGGMCYSFYLLHTQVIGFIGPRLSFSRFTAQPYPVDLAIQFLALSVPVFLVCASYYVLVERPCMEREWPQRLLGLIRDRITPKIRAASTAGGRL